jgi:hypothetical protein
MLFIIKISIESDIRADRSNDDISELHSGDGPFESRLEHRFF